MRFKKMNESQWLKDEINKNRDLLNKKISIDDMDKALYSENLKPTDRTRKFVKDNTKK